MTKHGLAALVLLASLSAIPAEEPTVQRVVAEGVRELGSDEFRAREAATSALLRLGLDAIPLLEAEMAKTKDAEVRRRVEGVIASIRRSKPALALTVTAGDKPIPLDPAGSVELKIRVQNVSTKPVVVCRLQGEMVARNVHRAMMFAMVLDGNGNAVCKELPGPANDNGTSAVLHMTVRDEAGKDLTPKGIVGVRADGLREIDFVTIQPGKDEQLTVKVPVKALAIDRPGVYELALNYRALGDGALIGVSVQGKSQKHVELLLNAYRCDVTAKVKLAFVAK